MAYIHKKTFDIIHSTNINGLLEQEYFEADDMIALPIRELNRRGYKTISSCSGHPFKELYEVSVAFDNKNLKGHYEAYGAPELRCHITFCDGISLPWLPKGFKADAEEDGLMITQNVGVCEDEFDYFEETLRRMRTLYNWALSLPDIGRAP